MTIFASHLYFGENMGAPSAEYFLPCWWRARRVVVDSDGSVRPLSLQQIGTRLRGLDNRGRCQNLGVPSMMLKTLTCIIYAAKVFLQVDNAIIPRSNSL